jgi:hypothetical protein
MRPVALLIILTLLGLGPVPAEGDPRTPPEPKIWAYGPPAARTTVPEAEPNDTCPGQPVQFDEAVDPAGFSSGLDIDWYQIYATAGSLLTIGTGPGLNCAPPYAEDTRLFLYGADCMTLLAFDDDSGPGLYSLITSFSAPTTGYYNVKVVPYGPGNVGCYRIFCQSVTWNPPPVNDSCLGALPLTSCSADTIHGDLTWATNNYNPQPPTPGCTGFSAAGRDLVYLMQLHAGDVVDLTYTGGNYDASIYIVTDCTAPGASCVAGADAGYEVETLHWTCPAPGTYYVIADAYGTSTGGTFTLRYAITCPISPGACCCPEGSCILAVPTDCQAPCVWYSDWNYCSPNPCPQPTGACCAVDGSCSQTAPQECSGIWLGMDTVCILNSPCPPPTGACCRPDGSCTVTVGEECRTPSVWRGQGIFCTPYNPCPPPVGACCHPEGTCTVILPESCQAPNVWKGLGTCCAPGNPCPQPTGACCGPDNTCTIRTLQQCQSPWVWQEPGEDCIPNPCPNSAGAAAGSRIAIPARPTAVPNPSSGPVVIQCRLDAASVVDLEIFDASGSLVRRLEEGPRAAGSLLIPWDGRDLAGRRLPAGIYVVRLVTPAGAASLKVTLAQ